MASHDTTQGVAGDGGAPAASGATEVVETAFDAIAAKAFATAMQNAVQAQQNAEIVRTAAVTQVCQLLLSLPLGDAKATQKNAASAQSEAARSYGDGAKNAAAPSEAALASVDPQVLDAVNAIREAAASNISPAGNNAQQMVALSAALAVQDATDAWRAMSIVSEVIASVAVAKFLASGDEKPLLGVTAAGDLMKAATEEFSGLSAAAGAALRQFS